jgi:glycosyltransferase involved in cell wall biosynthesis
MSVVTDARTAAGPGARSRESASGLHARLDAPLPGELAVGAGTALFVCGSCFHPLAEIRSLSLLLDGEPQPVMAERMPRLDVFRALHPTVDPLETSGLVRDPDSEDDPRFRGYRSGFWGIVEIEPSLAGKAVELGVRATLGDGADVDARLGRVELRSEIHPTSYVRAGSAPEKLVAICMATYNPPSELFERQIESIRQQTHRDWVCVISDDCSTPERVKAMEAAIGDDSRFVLSRSPGHLGFYANFERALAMAPADAAYAAMADQDDRWDPEKLEVLLEAIGDAGLVYSDARIVDRRGEQISDTYWSRRRNNYTDLVSLLIANTVTGAASLFRREVLDLALPFPPEHGKPYHDHWVGCVALATGKLAYVDRPLYDYVQHHEAALGHARANEGSAGRNVASRLRRIAGGPRSIVGRWRATYFWDVCRIVLFARILERRCGVQMSQAKGRAVRRIIAGERSALAIPWLLLRRTRSLAGRDETLGVETGLLRGIIWRHAVARLAGRSGRPGRRFRFSASLPPRSSLSTGPPIAHEATRTLADKTRPLEVSVRADAPSRVNLLIPTVDLTHFFGGYIAKLNLARRLAELGVRVRLVTVDETPPLPPSWRRTVESYDGLDGVFDRVEVAFAREEAPLELSPTDRFIATTWWTAHLAHIAVKGLGRERFVYLIQECEPFTFPMGAFAALARQSYGFPHFGVFSTELLRDYFRGHSLGVFAAGAEGGDRDSVSFENAITPIEPPTEAELAGRSSRRLLLYARPEAHAARNMFELAILALAKAIADGAIGPDWELNGVGAVGQGEPPVELGDDRVLELLPRSSQDDYAELLRQHDIGLALMYTPHPSLVPIEMASAGMLTVTNSFENKTPEAMAAISDNLVTVEPTIDGIVDGLRETAANVGDATRRAAGAQVRWSRDWDTSFNEEVMGRIASFLESC